MSHRANTRERQEPIDTDRLLAKAMRVLSLALPVIVSVAAIVNTILYAFAKNILGVEGLCLVASLLVARYFHQRSRNKEAVIYTTRIIPLDNAFEPDLVDYIVLILAAVLVAMSTFPSLLGLFG
jgi:hypothetical protein